jgi:hypothetical protein
MFIFWYFILMMVDNLNILIFIFFLIFINIINNVNTSLHLLFIAEILWVTLYFFVLFVGLMFDNLNLLSLTFFFLIFSALELGIGLVLLLFQNIFNRSLSLNDSDTNFLKFSTRFVSNLYVNKINWKK